MKNTKRIKKIIEAWSNHGGWQPKSGDEKRFKDMHTVDLFKNMYASKEYDAIFKGTKQFIDRNPLHGYNPGQDEAKYDAGASVKDGPTPSDFRRAVGTGGWAGMRLPEEIDNLLVKGKK